jgi:hypothetical protein
LDISGSKMKKTLGLVAGVVLLGAQGCFGMRPLQNPLPSNPTLLRALVRAVHAEGELKIREHGVAAADGGGVGAVGGGIAPPPQRLPGTALPTPTRGILAAESACAIALRAQIAALGNAIDASKFETAIDYRGGVQPALLTFVKHHKSFSKRE